MIINEAVQESLLLLVLMLVVVVVVVVVVVAAAAALVVVVVGIAAAVVLLLLLLLFSFFYYTMCHNAVLFSTARKGLPVMMKTHSIWRTEYVQFDMCGKTKNASDVPHKDSNSPIFPVTKSVLPLFPPILQI